ncbi:MAG: hypothetical protein ACYC2H_02990 [Thermoplasmatota archaeon]
MIGRVAAAVALALLVALPGAWAQEGTGDALATVTVDDPMGDTKGPLAKEAASHLDITHAVAQAGQDGLGFWVTVASLQTDASAPAGWELWLAFEYRGTRFDVLIEPTSTTVERPDEVNRILFGDADAWLWRLDAPGEGERLALLQANTDVATRTFNTTVPWDLVIEPGGNSPNPGEPLRIVEAASAWTPTLLGTPHNPFIISGAGAEALVTSDQAAFPDGTFLSVAGAVGDLSLATPLATRFSNGEATTMHWPVEVANHGTRDLDVTLTLAALGAEGRAPPGVRLGPGEAKVVNVYVTLPFAHEHGSMRSFTFTANSGAGDSATLRLGVDYPSIPQPAGHHPDLYLHGDVEQIGGALPLLGHGWMNTAEEDERSNAAHVGGEQGVCPGSGTQPLGGALEWGTLWNFGLDPGLRMGLDGRLDQTASLDITLEGRAAVPAGKLYARLVLGARDFGTELNLFEDNESIIASTPIAATPGPSSAGVHLDLPMPPELDLVPPSRNNDVRLVLLFCLDAPPPIGIAVAGASTFATLADAQPYSILTGGHLHLPLEEYHDAIPVSGTGQGLALSVPDPVRRAAPGTTVLWQPSLEVSDGADGRLAVRLFGAAAGQADLLAPANVPSTNTVLPVSIVVPDEPAGTLLDLLLDVTDEADPARSVALRLSVLVDPTATADDASLAAGLEPQEKESPGLPALALVGLMALVARCVRRRTQ